MNERENPEKRHEKASGEGEKVDVKKIEAEADVTEVASGIAAEVADLAIDSAESAEAGGESFSEHKGDKKDYAAPKSGAATDDKQNLFAHIQATVPTAQMKKEVASAIRKEIRKEEQKVLLAYVGLKKYSPHRLAEKIAKIRSLKDLLSGLVDATKEFLTGLYLKWVKRGA
ncbi:MAG: hypothetical protein K9L85_03535 [Candidatus Peribacteraceae bacterium]|nr:hypothetical protein [Candidatus Peribacteraceae bacterium]